MEETVSKLEQEVLKYKSIQMTKGDSANYYVVEYMPGWFIANGYRNHTIKCIPYDKSLKAIFMPVLAPNYYLIGGGSPTGRPLIYSQDIVTWMQIGETAEHLANEAYASGVPKGLVIYSNVDFYIETSYADHMM